MLVNAKPKRTGPLRLIGFQLEKSLDRRLVEDVDEQSLVRNMPGGVGRESECNRPPSPSAAVAFFGRRFSKLEKGEIMSALESPRPDSRSDLIPTR